LNQQDNGLSEIRIAEVSAGHQDLSDTQKFGVLGLDGKRNGRRVLALGIGCLYPICHVPSVRYLRRVGNDCGKNCEKAEPGQ
jgi:hypothetical protein